MSPRLLAADAAGIEAAAARIRGGGLVVCPTETVYGLAADATNASAVAGVFALKGRPHFNPLIAHVLDVATAEQEAIWPETAYRLAARFWPGPLTIVAPRRNGGRVCDLVCAGLSSIALRAPAHPVMRALIAAVGRPLAAPSANLSGRVSPTRAEHAAEDFAGQDILILDAGATELGLESTIVGVGPEGPRLLRPGAIAREAIEALTGPLPVAPTSARPDAPGMLASHYAPRARLRLDAEAPLPGEAMLGFGPVTGDLNLSPAGDLREAAANLFAYLRRLDAAGTEGIAVAPIPDEGLGEAIRDRLARAAAPR